MACFSPTAPGKMDYNKMLHEAVRGQVGVMPETLAAEDIFSRPRTGLALRQMNDLLYGTQAGSYDVQTYTPAIYQQGHKLSYGKTPSSWTGSVDADPLPTWDKNTRSYSAPAGSMTLDANTGKPVSDLVGGTGSPGRKYGRIGGGTGAAMGMVGGIPGMELIGGVLGNKIGGLFDSGPPKVQLSPASYSTRTVEYGAQPGLLSLGTLTPEEQRIAQQQSRAAYAARGLSGTGMSAADEVLHQFSMGQDLAAKRAALAAGYMGGPQFNPESAYAGNLANANQQMSALFAEPSTMDKYGMGLNTATGGLLGKNGSY
jgi:hypothetical protein